MSIKGNLKIVQVFDINGCNLAGDRRSKMDDLKDPFWSPSFGRGL